MKYDIQTIDNIIKYVEEGFSKSFLSKKYNIPGSTIRYWFDNKDKLKIKDIFDSNILDLIK